MGTSFPSKGDENPGLGFRNGSAAVQEPGIFPQVGLNDDPSAGTFLRGVKGTLGFAERFDSTASTWMCGAHLVHEESWMCSELTGNLCPSWAAGSGAPAWHSKLEGMGWNFSFPR